MREEKSIYDLVLHDKVEVNEDVYVTRVPGGWIYEFQKPKVNVLEIIFVPFDNDFQ